MTLLSPMGEQLSPGAYKGLVTNNVDPEGLGRLKASCPTLGITETAWALPMISPNAPAPGSGVWLFFEGGDLEHPIWAGSWQPANLKVGSVSSVFGRTGAVAAQTGDYTYSQISNTPTIPPPATTVTGPDAFGASAVVGTSTNYARQDHDHGLPTLITPAPYALVGNTTATSLPANTIEIIPLITGSGTTLAHGMTISSGTLVLPYNGIYEVHVSACDDDNSNVGAVITAGCYHNGSSVFLGTPGGQGNIAGPISNGGGLVIASASDYLQLVALQTNATPQTSLVNFTVTYLHAYYLGPQ
jgi:Type VI secretion system/phage-baseplate injector OB domain